MVTYHLKLVLPEFLLFRLVEEGEFADMMNEYVSQDGKLGVERRYLAIVGLEGRAESAEGGWGI